MESLTHYLRVGETGVSEGPAPDDPHEVIVKFDSVAMLAAMRVPRSLLVPVGEPMRSMRLWDKCTDRVKRDLLCAVGLRDPRSEVLPSTASTTLTLWGEYLPHGLSLGEETKHTFVPPAFVKALEEAHGLRQHVRQKLLTDWWSQTEVLLVCLCDEASASSSLLAVRKTPVSLRYYEAQCG